MDGKSEETRKIDIHMVHLTDDERAAVQKAMKFAEAATNSYARHCADPLAAAEADLLGEALAALDRIQRRDKECLRDHEATSDLAECGEIARAVLAMAGRAKP